MFTKKTLSIGISLAIAIVATSSAHAADKQLKSVGITVGSLGNPYLVTLVKGAEDEAKKINPDVKVTSVSADYDLNKQFTQIDNFISAHVDMILLNSADPKAIEPAVMRAKKAGIVVVAVDVASEGADATVQTNNVQAGALACEYIVKKLHGSGSMIIENGPQVSSIIDRVSGCKSVLAKSPGIKVLSDDQNGKASRDGGMNVMQGYLTRYPKIDAIFAINDPQAIGSDLAAKQLHRDGIIVTSVDGSPDVETALKSDSLIQASASQDPYSMAQKAILIGYSLMNGHAPANPMTLIPSTLVTRENISSYKGWTSPR
jgi:ribose transport system substrate-binding protein